MNSPYERWLGAALQATVETQLLNDLQHYGINPNDLKVDWAAALGEGHSTKVLGGYLEEVSGLSVLDREGNIVAKGWMDFIHRGSEPDPLFVFWLYLYVRREDGFRKVKKEPTIPPPCVGAGIRGDKSVVRPGR